METDYRLVRTTTANEDFQKLVLSLDHELWNELQEDQTIYDQYNKVINVKTAVVIYERTTPVACGCFKAYATDTVEIKRMYVQKAHRGNGLSKQVLKELERWATENDYRYAVLETSVRFVAAKQLYHSNGYQTIPNYGPYAGLKESVCMKKKLNP
ncbi:MAG TPA: GNAT family N-acetyltransferase [Flavisolibacter sp.]|nr:GNAT family N-acetyltransferase [Flavisolibacter sp.]